MFTYRENKRPVQFQDLPKEEQHKIEEARFAKREKELIEQQENQKKIDAYREFREVNKAYL